MFVLSFTDYAGNRKVLGPFQSRTAAMIHAEEDVRTARRILGGWMKDKIGYTIIEVEKPGKTVSPKGVISRAGLTDE